jgi:hypothetical protein
MRADRLPAIHHVQTAMPEGGEADARRFYGDLPGYARFYLDDPFGNRVEILQPADARPSLVDVLRNGPDLGELDLARDVA